MTVMPLFTLFLEFDGGTYISQFRAASVQDAIAQYSPHVVGNKAISASSLRKRLAESLSAEKPVAIHGVRNVWCCSVSVGKKFALLNVVTTA